MSRSTTILIASFVALVAITYFLVSSNDREGIDASSNPSVQVDSASIVKIDIRQPKNNIVIENVGGRWMLTSPIKAAADPIAVYGLLGGASRLKIGSLISTNPEKQHIFQVDSSGTIVTFRDRAGTSTTLIIGKMGPSFSEIYFRLPASKDVYLASGLDNWTVNKGVKEWRDKSIVRASADAIKEISIGENGKNFVFTHDSTGWKSGDKSIDAMTINPLLTTLSNLQAEDFVDSAVTFNGKMISIKIRTFEDVDLLISPVSQDAAKYYARSSKAPQVFLLSKWTVDQLMKPTGKTNGTPLPAVTQQQPKHAPAEVKNIPEQPVRTPVTPPVTGKPVVKKEVQPPPLGKDPVKEKTVTPPVEKKQTPPVSPPTQNADVKQGAATDDDGELTIHVVKAGESMTTIAKKYGVTTEQILKWNLLKSIAVKPGQELYIYIKK